MRHFRDALDLEGNEVEYTQLGTRPTAGVPRGLAGSLRASLARAAVEGRPPDQLVVVEPGEWRVQDTGKRAETALLLPCILIQDGLFNSPSIR
jgi:deoxyribodipyrimidine photolyase-like uncharacterized protein